MSVDFFSATPKSLLDKFNNAIEQDASKEKITTWVRSNDKKYYTHKADERNVHTKRGYQPCIKHMGSYLLTDNVYK
ncbi:hypothetical protein QCD58_004349 [Enterobacter hormaechei]|nr:hypothetical protein [Enterobacter hormaechei]